MTQRSPPVRSLRTQSPSLSTTFATSLIAKWGDQIAEDIEPLEIQKWFNGLHNKEEYGWTTVSKIRGIMNRIFKIGIIHKKVTKNPVEGLATSTKTTYKAIKITPAQTLLILRSVMGNMLHFTLVFLVAATALRSSEVLSLRWADILWEERKIRIVKSWKKSGVDGEHEDTIFGTRCTDGQGVDPLLARMAQANAIRQAHGFRVSRLLREGAGFRSAHRYSAPTPTTSSEKGWGCHPRWASLGSAQPPPQPVELAGEQGEGEPEDGAGNLGSFADSDHARPLHRRRPRRDDRGSGKVSRRRGIRTGSVQ